MRIGVATLAIVLLVGCGSKREDAAGGDAAVDGGIDAPPSRVTVRVLGINDFHGALAPTTGAGDMLFGGAARLAARVKAARTPNSIFVSAGDLIGGSPLASGGFHDEPTIRVMNEMGLELNAVGNHEFDEGTGELLRMQSGGCHATDGCAGAAMFPGAKFGFLAANVRYKSSGKTVFPPYVIREFSGVKVAFVGMTTKNTPATTVTSLVDDLVFDDEVETMTALVPKIRAEGAETIVFMVHEGGGQASAVVKENGCLSPVGPVFDWLPKLPAEVKVVITGHSHGMYNCSLSGRVLTQSASRGHLFSQIDLDFEGGRFLEAKATNETVNGADAPDPAVDAIVSAYSKLASDKGDAKVGSISETLDGPAMGRVIADAMLQAGAKAGAEAALMNTGGIRAALSFARSGPELTDGEVRYIELFEVQPFNNALTVLTITGDKLLSVLDGNAVVGRLYVAGMTYSQNSSAEAGGRVLAADVLIGGAPLDPAKTYRVVTNSITVAYPEFVGAPQLGLGLDIDALVAWFGAKSPIGVSPERIFTK